MFCRMADFLRADFLRGGGHGPYSTLHRDDVLQRALHLLNAPVNC